MRKTLKDSKTLTIVVVLLLNMIFYCIFGLTSCAKPTEGCLDILASNYDVTADIDCCLNETVACCCTYPNLKLRVSHKLKKNDDAVFNFDSFHTTDSIHFFKVDDLRFFISDLHLIRTNGQPVGVRDSIHVYTYNPIDPAICIENRVEDNIALIKRTNSSYTMGAYSGEYTYDSITFLVGIKEPLNKISLDSLPTNHVLNGENADSLYIEKEKGFFFNKIELHKDTFPETDSLVLKINTLVPITLPFIEPLWVNAGFDVTVDLRINYLEWFKGINFAVATEEDIKTSIIENTVNVFELEE